MFIKFWVLWALATLAAAAWLLWWSVRTHQFEEQRRAGLLPFDDVAPERPKHGSQGRFHLALLLGLAVLGTVLTALTVILALINPGEG